MWFCPLIEESELVEAKSVTEIYEGLTAGYLRGIPCGAPSWSPKSRGKKIRLWQLLQQEK